MKVVTQVKVTQNGKCIGSFRVMTKAEKAAQRRFNWMLLDAVLRNGHTREELAKRGFMVNDAALDEMLKKEGLC